jgi:hypothetical protein
MATHRWRNNAEMIAAIAPLYFRPEDLVVDFTYGRGNFWTQFRPENLRCHDLYLLDGIDARKPPYGRQIDIAVLDLPYQANGGETTSTVLETRKAYGQVAAMGQAKDPAGMQDVIDSSIRAVAQTLRPAGLLLVKCSNYITSGRLWPGVMLSWQTGTLAGLQTVDLITLVGNPGPQPMTRKVIARDEHGKPKLDENGDPLREEVPTVWKHAAQNSSTLIVFGADRGSHDRLKRCR